MADIGDTATGTVAGTQGAWQNHPSHQLHQLGQQAAENAPRMNLPDEFVRPLDFWLGSSVLFSVNSPAAALALNEQC